MGARGAMAVQSANMERAKHCVPCLAAGVSVSMESSDADAERAAHPPGRTINKQQMGPGRIGFGVDSSSLNK